MEFVKSKFELILLGVYVYFYTFIVMWGSVYGHNSVIDFAVDNNKLFVGALLGLLTGRAMTRNGDSNGKTNNGNGTAADPAGSGSVTQR